MPWQCSKLFVFNTWITDISKHSNVLPDKYFMRYKRMWLSHIVIKISPQELICKWNGILLTRLCAYLVLAVAWNYYCCHCLLLSRTEVIQYHFIYWIVCIRALAILLEFTRCSLWSSGQSFWLQIQRSRFDSRHYQIFWKVMGLEQGLLSLMSTIEELLGRKSSGSGQSETTAIGIWHHADHVAPWV
jgi:hypothetical protein